MIFWWLEAQLHERRRVSFQLTNIRKVEYAGRFAFFGNDIEKPTTTKRRRAA